MIYPIAIFLSAALLFAIQPFVGKVLLPVFGGTPAVWSGCLLFFQATLLIGYLYAHLLGGRGRVGAAIHLLLLCSALFLLPVQYTAAVTIGSSPLLSLLLLLAVSYGPIAILLSATSPLLQRWFANSSDREPYWLYRASNAGSFIGLFSYPIILERYFDLSVQSLLLSVMFLSVVGCIAIVGLSQRKVRAERVVGGPNSPLMVIALSALGSTLLLAVTAHLSTSIAAMPFLWTLPLGIYLFTFILTFQEEESRVITRLRYLAPHALLVLTPFLFFELPGRGVITIFAHTTLFFVLVTLLHRKLYEERPRESGVTTFYLYIALGGVFGGVLNTFIAPSIFDTVAEYPLAIVASMPFLLLRSSRLRRELLLGLVFAAVVIVGYLLTPVAPSRALPVGAAAFYAAGAFVLFPFRGNPRLFSGMFLLLITPLWIVHSQILTGSVIHLRNFFGVKQVVERDGMREFVHAGTVHGIVSLAEPMEPAGYFSRQGPVGDIFRVYRGRRSSEGLHVAVVGLGIGSMLAYVEGQDQFFTVELDPQVAELAGNSSLFPYLSSCGARCELKVGDGRIELQQSERSEFDIIFLDAFTSDSVPLHLLSIEAIELYLRKLKSDGIAVFNISNRFFDLRKQLAIAASAVGARAFVRENFDLTPEAKAKGALPSVYLVISRDGSIPPQLEAQGWRAVEATGRVWSDRFSSLFDARM